MQAHRQRSSSGYPYRPPIQKPLPSIATNTAERELQAAGSCRELLIMLAPRYPFLDHCFASIADFGLVGASGENDSVSHALNPDGRSCPSNSPYAFKPT